MSDNIKTLKGDLRGKTGINSFSQNEIEHMNLSNIKNMLQGHFETLSKINREFEYYLSNHLILPEKMSLCVDDFKKATCLFQQEVADSLSIESLMQCNVDSFCSVGNCCLPVIIDDTYVLNKHIANGHFAMVLSAFDAKFNREVVMKFPLIDSVERFNKLELFAKEASILSRVSQESKGVVAIYDYSAVLTQVSVDNCTHQIMLPYIVMEKMDCNLTDKYYSNYYFNNPLVAVEIVYELALTLHAVHTCGNVMHNDIKPDNIYLRKKAKGGIQVKLGDFGLAQGIKYSNTRDIIKNGCLEYIAPERLEFKPYDIRADIYSLGCILYYLLTGQRPFSQYSDSIEIFGAIVRGQKIPSSTVKPYLDKYPELIQICNKVMATNPDDRYDNALQFSEALITFLSDHS